MTGPNSELAVMGGSLNYEQVFGVKTYTTSKMGHSFHILLYSSVNGELIAFMEANRLGQLRTGATSAVAVKYLARNTMSTVGMIGTGFQSMTQIQAISKVHVIEKLKVYSRNAKNRELFRARASKCLSLPVIAVENNEAAIIGSNIVICIASNTTPIIQGNWLNADTLIIAAGPANSDIQELDQAAIRSVSHFAVDSLAQAPHEAGDIKYAVNKGLLRWTQVRELHSLISGNAIPNMPNGISYVKLMGTGLADIAAAKLAYDCAIKHH
jgi:ornithine cyclodeaminase/alanine dehydrogenase-like protein (mu-crystallin family)